MARMVSSAEGGSGFLRRTTKPATWRGGLQVEEDAIPIERCDEQRKEWGKHWQWDSEVQGLEDTPWRNEELRSFEEVLRQLTEKSLERVARSHKATTGVGCDGFHPKVLADASQETRKEAAEFLGMLNEIGRRIWKTLRVLRGYFEHQWRVQFAGMRDAPYHHGHLLWVRVELLVLSLSRYPERSGEGVSAFAEDIRERCHSFLAQVRQEVRCEVFEPGT